MDSVFLAVRAPVPVISSQSGDLCILNPDPEAGSEKEKVLQRSRQGDLTCTNEMSACIEKKFDTPEKGRWGGLHLQGDLTCELESSVWAQGQKITVRQETLT